MLDCLLSCLSGQNDLLSREVVSGWGAQDLIPQCFAHALRAGGVRPCAAVQQFHGNLMRQSLAQTQAR
jgi:hypothetical protein